jgi:hypothetical protein
MSFHRIRDPGALSISPAAKDECELVHISRKRLIAVGGPIAGTLAKVKRITAVTISRLAEIKT